MFADVFSFLNLAEMFAFRGLRSTTVRAGQRSPRPLAPLALQQTQIFSAKLLKNQQIYKYEYKYSFKVPYGYEKTRTPFYDETPDMVDFSLRDRFRFVHTRICQFF